MWKSSDGKDYRLFRNWCSKDVAMWIIASGIFTYFFYRSLWGIVVAVPGGYLYVLIEKRGDVLKEVRIQREAFKECIQSVAASLRAGYAPAGAFAESKKDMVHMYGEESEIVKNLDKIQNGLRNNQTLESLLISWGKESKVEEISEFADVFSIAKRSGGSAIGVIESTALMIWNRMEAEREIETLLAGKRMEQRVMSGMPFLILFYLQISNPGYFDVLYHNAFGVVVMTGMLSIYLWSHYYCEKILEEVFR